MIPQLENPVFPNGLTVWLDDRRSMPDGYDLHVKTAEAMLKLIEFGCVSGMSLDHDLGPGMSGSQMTARVTELAHDGKIRPICCRVHSGNSAGAQDMIKDLSRANQYWGIDWFIPYEPDWR